MRRAAGAALSAIHFAKTDHFGEFGYRLGKPDPWGSKTWMAGSAPAMTGDGIYEYIQLTYYLVSEKWIPGSSPRMTGGL